MKSSATESVLYNYTAGITSYLNEKYSDDERISLKIGYE